MQGWKSSVRSGADGELPIKTSHNREAKKGGLREFVAFGECGRQPNASDSIP